MRPFITMLRLDTRLILRDKILWYVLVFPAISAAMLLLVSGRINSTPLTFAVDTSVPSNMVSALERVANLDYEPDRHTLFQRVERFDHVPGIFWEKQKIQVIYEGNEGRTYIDQTNALIKAALNAPIPEIQVGPTNASSDFIVRIIIAALLIAPALIGGTVSGFLIVADKEHHVIRGYQIAPLQLSTYIGAKSLLASAIGVISTITLSFILGIPDKIQPLMFLLLCSLPLFGLITMLFGAIAKDKVSCIAMFKILVVVFLVLPLVSAFVPTTFHRLFYPLPMFWQFSGVMAILNHHFDFKYGLGTFLSSGLLLGLVVFVFRNKIQKI